MVSYRGMRFTRSLGVPPAASPPQGTFIAHCGGDPQPHLPRISQALVGPGQRMDPSPADAASQVASQITCAGSVFVNTCCGPGSGALRTTWSWSQMYSRQLG